MPPDQECSCPRGLSGCCDQLGADGRDVSCGCGGGSVSRDSVVRGGSLGLEALAAEDGAALGWFEWDCCFDAAFGAMSACFSARDSGGCGSATRAACGSSLRFAWLAALGIVLELLVEEEELFAGGKDKLSATICTRQKPVNKFHSRFSQWYLRIWLTAEAGELDPPGGQPLLLAMNVFCSSA